MIEVVTQHTGPAGSGARTIMMFNVAATPTNVSDAQADVRAFWQSLINVTSTTFTRTVLPDSRSIDAITGAIDDILTNTSPTLPVVGTKADLPVPDVCQILTRWNTAGVENGRRVRGRSFLPGFTVAAVSGGNVTSTTLATVQAAATNLAVGNGMCVWHRPVIIDEVLAKPGAPYNTESAGVWSEWAVQRGRRA